MKTTTVPLLLGSAAAFALAISPAHAELGDDVATRLNNLYNDVRPDCGKPSMPAFLCSGVTLRATWPSMEYNFWSISPLSQKSGGVSASYLRKDAKYNKLAYGLNSGFIFDTIIGNPKDHTDYQVLCSFPIDAGTNGRAQQGCGDSSQTPASIEKLCHEEGVTTAAQWQDNYAKKGRTRSLQCGFDVSDNRNEAGGPAFYESIKAMATIADESFTTQNELRIAVWKDNPPKEPSILAAFYTEPSGRDSARLYQAQWWKATQQQLPMVHLQLPNTRQEDARFTFDSKEQLIYPVTAKNACPRYFEKASWVERHDPGFGRKVWTLSITPTDCGRNIGDSQTNNFFNELAAEQYMDNNWKGNPDNRDSNIASMRRQLTCHFLIARNKPEWNLEPSRPYVNIQDSKAQGCNNT